MTGYVLERKLRELPELTMSSTEVLCYVFVISSVNAQCLCWLTVLMRVCHTSMKTGEEVLTRLAFWVQAGHFHSGMDNMAMAGVTKANVPPCRIGSLQVWNRQNIFSVSFNSNDLLIIKNILCFWIFCSQEACEKNTSSM